MKGTETLIVQGDMNHNQCTKQICSENARILVSQVWNRRLLLSYYDLPHAPAEA